MNKAVAIVGPTATGKTAIAVTLAKKMHGELVSADSRQVYRGMDIGTGKDKESLENVPIWMYDVAFPNEPWNVALYATQARRCIEDIQTRGKLPIIVGGSGLYIQSLVTPLTVAVLPDEKLRKKLSTVSKLELQTMLQTVGKHYWDSMNVSDRQNPRRLIRKIEIARNKDTKNIPPLSQPIDVLFVGLSLPYSKLYAIIDARVERRVKQGVVEEIQSLLRNGYGWNLPSMSGLGYRQWKDYIEGKTSKAETIKRWKFDEHAYARRQMTWFKKQTGISWFDPTKPDVEKEIESFVRSWYTEG